MEKKEFFLRKSFFALTVAQLTQFADASISSFGLAVIRKNSSLQRLKNISSQGKIRKQN